MYKSCPNNTFLYESPLGKIRLSEKSGYLIRLEFVERNLESEFVPENKKKLEDSFFRKICLDLDKYFSGDLKIFNLPIKLDGTNFQRSAWGVLLSIPYGETISYLQQAKTIGNPKATRAIGKANSKNPIPIIIPCHRVIGKNGSLTGYSGGSDLKEKLLAHEHFFKSVQKN